MAWCAPCGLRRACASIRNAERCGADSTPENEGVFREEVEYQWSSRPAARNTIIPCQRGPVSAPPSLDAGNACNHPENACPVWVGACACHRDHGGPPSGRHQIRGRVPDSFPAGLPAVPQDAGPLDFEIAAGYRSRDGTEAGNGFPIRYHALGAQLFGVLFNMRRARIQHSASCRTQRGTKPRRHPAPEELLSLWPLLDCVWSPYAGGTTCALHDGG